jgi:hypothetical protein
MTVAVGLALLVFMPLPFMRSMGVGGLLVLLVSIVAGGDVPVGDGAAGEPAARGPAADPRPARVEGGDRRVAPAGAGNHAPARGVGRDRGGAADRAGAHRDRAAPHQRRQPRPADHHRGGARAQAPRGHARPGRTGAAPVRRRHRAAGRRIRTRGRRGAASADRRAAARSRGAAEHDPGPGADEPGAGATRDPGGRGRAVVQIRAAGRSDSGEPPEQDLVHRIRDTYVPGAHFPPSRPCC